MKMKLSVQKQSTNEKLSKDSLSYYFIVNMCLFPSWNAAQCH